MTWNDMKTKIDEIITHKGFSTNYEILYIDVSHEPTNAILTDENYLIIE